MGDLRELGDMGMPSHPPITPITPITPINSHTKLQFSLKLNKKLLILYINIGGISLKKAPKYPHNIL